MAGFSLDLQFGEHWTGAPPAPEPVQPYTIITSGPRCFKKPGFSVVSRSAPSSSISKSRRAQQGSVSNALRESLAARANARLIGRRVKIPASGADSGDGREGTIAAVSKDKCLIDLAEVSPHRAASPTPPQQPTTLSTLKWAAMVHADTDTDVGMTQLPGLLEGLSPHTSGTGGVPRLNSDASSSSDVSSSSRHCWSHQAWYPTFKVRKWLLPDVDGALECLRQSSISHE